MRICRAMAMFRPSFIALIMNLTPEDLIFMEKCFQRTILVSFFCQHFACVSLFFFQFYNGTVKVSYSHMVQK